MVFLFFNILNKILRAFTMVFNKIFSGYGDFIHASYVIGGPLQNKFILTQAPLLQTISDFWRMIWQEKSEYIFMLCDATNTESFKVMGYSMPDCCPYYWPR